MSFASPVSSVRNWVKVKLRLWPIRKKLLFGPARFVRIHQGALNLSSIAKACPDAATLVEIGANSGEDTLRMLNHFSSAQIYCFEPDHRAIQRWRSTVGSSRASLSEQAVGGYDGSTQFFASFGTPAENYNGELSRDWDLSGSIRRPTEHLEKHPWIGFRNPQIVTMVTLDTFFEQKGLFDSPSTIVSLIWMDVQGAEGDVILGAPKTLERTKFLYTEYSNDELYDGQPSLNKLCKLLPDFSIQRLWKNDVLFQNKKA